MTDLQNIKILKPVTYAEKMKPFFQYCEDENIMPSESIIDDFFGETSLSFRIFIIVYSFYFFPAKEERAHKPHLIYKKDIKKIVETILPIKIKQELERIRLENIGMAV